MDILVLHNCEIYSPTLLSGGEGHTLVIGGGKILGIFRKGVMLCMAVGVVLYC